MLSGLLPSVDLTSKAAERQLQPSSGDFSSSEIDGGNPFEVALRALYRSRRRHILITGLRGVGKTQFVVELARKSASGEIPFLECFQKNLEHT